MDAIPERTARAIVLRHLPRALRAALDPDAARGRLPAQLISDADVASPGLGPALASWVRANVGECPGLAGWLEAAGHPRPVEAASGNTGDHPDTLDRASALADDPTLRDIADALVLLGAFDRVAPLAGRAAAAAWAYQDRLREAGARLHQLDLASRGPQEPDLSPSVPWPELDELGYPAARARDAAAQAWHAAVDAAFEQIRQEVRLLAIGLSALAGGYPIRTWTVDTLGQTAVSVGRSVVETLTLAAAGEARDEAERRFRAEIEASRKERASEPREPEPPPPADIPPMHVVICSAVPATGAGKGRDAARGYEHAIGHALPLMPVPDLARVGRALSVEFPYALDAIGAVLGDFLGRPHVHAPPLLIVGAPGSGKTRFVRRLGEALGVGVHRVDGSNDGGGSFGGTERRWYSSEPCRPFMAIARHRHANPIVLVDEVDKAATRTDYGRLWDSMLQALDPENAARFPDPSLQAEVDISWVTVICTANGTAGLPGAFLDRFRLVRFPDPQAEHLDALLPGILDGLAREAGMDPRFHRPVDGVERAALRARWRGGSIRRLRRAVEAVLRVRERSTGNAVH